MKKRTNPLDGLVSPATRRFFRAAMSRRELRPAARLLEALHGYIYLRSPRTYIGTALGRSARARALRPHLNRMGRLLGLWTEEGTGKSFADSYHGKVMPAAAMTRVLRIGRSLDLQTPENVLPYSAARRLLLENPLDLAVLDCPCRAVAPNPCLPLDVCLIVGQPFVDFVLQHHADASRRITVDEGAAIVEQSLKRGHVTHAFFKEAMLGRFYAICNCCSCCCGAMEAHRAGVPMIASSGFVSVPDAAGCNGCGRCSRKCPFQAIAYAGEPGDKPVPVIDRARCMGCGVCVAHCPTNALRLERDPSLPAPLLDFLEQPSDSGAAS